MNRCFRLAIISAAFLFLGFMTANWLARRKNSSRLTGHSAPNVKMNDHELPGFHDQNPLKTPPDLPVSEPVASDLPLITVTGSAPLRAAVYKEEGIMELFEGMNSIATFNVSIGSNPDLGDKLGPGDRRTPEGKFRIVSKEDSSHWEKEGRLSYGPWFLRLDTGRWRGIGIHGTDEPENLGKPSSEGCIRVENRIVSELRDLLPIGTEVEIRRRRS